MKQSARPTRQASPAQDLLFSSWTTDKALWAIAKDVVSGNISHIGTPRLIVWAYVLTFLEYVVMLVWGCLVVATMVITRDTLGMTYFKLSYYATILGVLPIVGYALYRVGRTTWGKSYRRVTAVMLLSILACISPIIVPLTLYNILPTYCDHYMQAVPATSGTFVPKEQLTAEDCVSYSVQPLDKSIEVTCASYMDETAPNTFAVRPEVCQPGTTPPPRSASTSQITN